MARGNLLSFAVYIKSELLDGENACASTCQRQHLFEKKKEPGLAKKNKPRDIRTAMRRRIK